MAHKNKSNYSAYKARNPVGQKPGLQRGQHRKPVSIYSTNEANDRLFELFRNHGGDFITHTQRIQLAEFYSLLMHEQGRNNFTRLMTLKDVGLKHFLDSLLVTQLTELKFPLMDMGTGPGLPGIPLKIFYPEQKILLAEGVQKRVEFLKKVREKLNLKNLDIIGRNIDSSFVYPLQGVITRAVEDAANSMRNISQCLEVGGRLYLMKGPGADPELELAKSMAEYYKLIEDHHYEIPQTPHKRRLLVFEKIKVVPLGEENDEN
jgi:16S rRNA (guanine527-N7)-methyltransferase